MMYKKIMFFVIVAVLSIIPNVYATAIAGEPFRGVCQIKMDSAVGDRGFTVSATTIADSFANQGNQTNWENYAGLTLSLQFQWNTSGGPTFGQAENVAIQTRIPGGAVVGSTWSPAIAGDDGIERRTMHFDSDPLNEVLDANRSGVLELYMIINKTSIPAWGSLDCRDSITNPPAATTVTTSRGYVRANMTIRNFTISNVSLNGAEPTLWAFNNSIFAEYYLGADLYEALQTSFQIQDPAGFANVRTDTDPGSTTNKLRSHSLTDTIQSGTTAAKINNDFDVDLDAINIRVASPGMFGGDRKYVFNLTGYPTGFSQVDEQDVRNTSRMNIDPRLNLTLLFQKNNNSFGFPPMSLNDPMGSRLVADFGFLAARIINAQGTGQQGLQHTLKLWDIGQLTGSNAVPTRSASVISTTQGGETGWSSSLLSWPDSLPGGQWIFNVTITTTGATNLERNNNRTLLLVAPDPRTHLVGTASNNQTFDLSNIQDHFYPGQPLYIISGLEVSNADVIVETPADAGTSYVALVYSNQTDGFRYFLNSDYQWQKSSGSYYNWPMMPAPNTNLSFIIFDAANTSTWPYYDINFIFATQKSGVTYQVDYMKEVVGGNNRHSGETAGDPLMQLHCTDRAEANEVVYCSFTSQNLNGTTRNDLTFLYEVTDSANVLQFSGTTTNTNARGKYRFSFTPTLSDTYEVTIFNDTQKLAMTEKVQVVNRGGMNSTQNAELFTIKNNITVGLGNTQLNLTIGQGITNGIINGFRTAFDSLDAFLRAVWNGWTAQTMMNNITNNISNQHVITRQYVVNSTSNITVGNVSVNSTEIADAFCNRVQSVNATGFQRTVCYQINKTYVFRGVGA